MSVSNNGRISDWKKVIQENGVDGVIVRLGYSGVEDKELAYNIQEFNRLGIPYGVYLYTYAEMKQMLRMMLNRPLNF